MFVRASEIRPVCPSPSIYLDHGTVAETCESGVLELSERGIRFESHLHLEIGTQLLVALSHMHPRRGLCRMSIEGIVVGCDPRPDQRCECAILFLELPDALRTSLREFSFQRK